MTEADPNPFQELFELRAHERLGVRGDGLGPGL